MTVGKKIALVVLILVLLGAGGAVAYFYFQPPKEETKLPEMVETESYFYPYTGLKSDDEESTKKRPLCVKIPNNSGARPHFGINSADVVYETMVEGGETRLNAIFQSNVPDEVGPIRSARLSDIWIVPQYNGMLFFSGANSQVDAAIANNNITNMNWTNAASIYYRASNGRSNLYNLNIELSKAYEVAKDKGYEISSDELSPLHFAGVKYSDKKDTDADDTSQSAADSDSDDEGQVGGSKMDALDSDSLNGTQIKINTGGNSEAEFKWNVDKKRYLKWANGSEHKDGTTNEQVNVVNVIIMWAQYNEQAKKDAAGSSTYDTVLGGKGDAVIFKDGKRYDCKWEADKKTTPRFYDSKGTEVLLNPGNTWILVPPTGTDLIAE